MLEKLTIIIPTYKRQIFAIRCMQYWSGKKISIIILDGSKFSVDVKILNKFEKNITYYHNPIGYYERILSAINLIKTDYVLLGCDDDFYIPSVLNTCIKKMNDKSEIISCCGRALGFDYKNNLVYGNDIYPRLNEQNSLLDTNPNNRIKKHFLNYEQSHTYAISRSNIWKIAAQTIFSKEYQCYSMHELQFEFLLNYAGKSTIIPELMWLRSDENQPIRDMSPSLQRSNTIWNWWYDKKFSNERKNFIIRMNNACLKIDKLNNINNTPDIISGINYYLEFCKKQQDGLFYLLIIKILRLLPKFLKNSIKKFLKNFSYKIKKKPLLSESAELFELAGVKVDFVELKIIEKYICSFYKKN